MKKIKTRVIVILVGVFCCFSALDYGIKRFILFPSFLAIEKDQAIENAKRVTQAVQRELFHLDTLCHDWSAWDATYDYAASSSDAYIEENLPESVFYDNQLNYIAILNRDRKVLYHKTLALSEKKPITIDDFPTDRFPESHPLLSYALEGHALSDVSVKGLFMTNQGPILISSRPILANRNEGPIRGSMIMGRLLNHEMVQKIREQTRIDFSIHPMSPESIPATRTHIPGQITESSPYFIQTEGDSFLKVYTVLNDLEGKPSLLVEANNTRAISIKGTHTLQKTFVLKMALSVIIVALLLMIQQTVFNKIAKLTHHVQTIQQTGDLSRRIETIPQDEIGILANEFNHLLNQLNEKTAKSRRFEEELRESEEQFRSIVENSHDGIILVGSDYKFQYVNDEFCKISGRSHDELIGEDFRVVLDAESIDLVSERYRQRQRGESAPARYEFNILRKSGEKRRIEFNGNVIKNSSGQVKTVGQLLDITKNREVEEDKKRLEMKLRQAQKMEAIGTLAGGIAHDFNNILSAILGYAQLTLINSQGNEKICKYIQQLIASSDRAKSLVQQILAFSRQTKVEKIPVDIGMVFKEVLKLIRPSIPATIAITHNVASNLGAIMADQTQIHQVLMNLCVNASQAMEEMGGELHVELLPVELTGEDGVTGGTLEPGKYLRLTVKDTGVGMDEETMSHIFEPYFTTKIMKEGTGMGLATVHGIVADCGGDIRVASTPGAGATFQVLFPVVEKEATTVTNAILDLPTGTEQVLFVDDEKFLVDIGIEMLKDLGYKVEGRTSSHDAFEAFRANANKYDIVITDMTMPEMTGEILAMEIKKIRPDIPIIICSGFSKEMTQNKAQRIGVNTFLNKPITMEELAHAIRKELNACS